MSRAVARAAVLAAALQQIFAPALIFRGGGFGGFSAGESLPTPAQPAGYAFAIWGLIYAWCLVYAIVGALPRYRRAPAFDRVAWPSAALFALSTVWLLLARDGPLWATVPVIWTMLALAAWSMLQLARWPTPLPRAVKFVAGWPLAIYAGWLTAASFVNSAAILPTYGTGTAGLGVEGLGVLMVAMAGALALALLVLGRGALPYALAVVWALTGIVVANRAGSATVTWAATLAAVALLGALLALRRGRRRRARRALAPA